MRVLLSAILTSVLAPSPDAASAEAEIPAGAALKWSVESKNPAILSVAVAPDGQTIVTAGEDAQLRFWNAETGESEGAIDQHRDSVYSIIYSPDGTRLISVSLDESIQVWDLARRRPERKFAWPASKLYACNLVITPDGEKVIAASGPRIQIWATDTGEEVNTIRAEDHNVVSISLSADGSLLASGDGYANVHVWDVETGQDIRRMDGSGTTVVFLPDDNVLAVRDPDAKIQLWSEGGELMQTLELSPQSPGSANNFRGPLAVSPGGEWLAAAVDVTAVAVFDVNTGELLARYEGQDDRVTSLSFLPDGRLVSASRDGSIIVWNQHLES